MFHILLALVFKNQPWKTGTFSKVCLVSNGCEESQSSRVSCRLRFHCICCLRYTHSGNCKLPESHNTQMKKKIPQIKGTHIQWKLKLVESGWNWWRSILREFSFFLFLMFLSASHKKPASHWNPTDPTTSHNSKWNNNSFKGYWDKKPRWQKEDYSKIFASVYAYSMSRFTYLFYILNASEH